MPSRERPQHISPAVLAAGVERGGASEPVGQQHLSGVYWFRVHERERAALSYASEERFASAEEQRVNDQLQLVEKIFIQEIRDQGWAADNVDIFSRFVL